MEVPTHPSRKQDIALSKPLILQSRQVFEVVWCWVSLQAVDIPQKKGLGKDTPLTSKETAQSII